MSLNWKEAIISPGASIRDAIQAIDKEALKIALVVGTEGELIGVVTDGDIRRGLLRKLELEDSVASIMNSNPTVCSPKESLDTIRRILEEKVLLHMPIVEGGKVVNLVTWDQIHARRRYDNPILLMAGGFGTRLKPLTNDTPKPLLKVGEKPILESILERFAQKGFHKFFISLHYLPEMVKEHFGDGSQWNVSIEYMHEPQPLGTAGALGLLPKEKLDESPMIVMNGDVLTGINFEQLLAFHIENQASATMCVRKYHFQVPYGVVEADGHRITEIVEKPQQQFFVNAGIYVLNHDIVSKVAHGQSIDMPNLLTEHINEGQQVSMFPVHEYWLDIGKKEDFEKAQIDYPRDFA